MKKKACTEIGINSFGTDFTAECTQAELLAKIDELNAGEKNVLQPILLSYSFIPSFIPLHLTQLSAVFILLNEEFLFITS